MFNFIDLLLHLLLLEHYFCFFSIYSNFNHTSLLIRVVVFNNRWHSSYERLSLSPFSLLPAHWLRNCFESLAKIYWARMVRKRPLSNWTRIRALIDSWFVVVMVKFMCLAIELRIFASEWPRPRFFEFNFKLDSKAVTTANTDVPFISGALVRWTRPLVDFTSFASSF